MALISDLSDFLAGCTNFYHIKKPFNKLKGFFIVVEARGVKTNFLREDLRLVEWYGG
jgi:hypothetical protein